MTMEVTSAEFEYVGNWQTPIPSALVLDARLLPSEKLVWMAIRATQMRPDSATKQTYDYLQLSCSLSRPTVSKCLKALQLTGWMQARRQSTAGWIESTRYLMFDTEQTERMVQSQEFIQFAESCAIQSPRLRTIVAALAERFAIKALALASSKNSELLPDQRSKKIELPGSKVFLPPEIDRSKKIELPVNLDFPSSKKIELPRMRDVVSSSSTTTLGERAGARELVWPEGISEITRNAKAATLAMMEPERAQQVLDELSAKMALGNVGNPTSYLHGLIVSVQAGTFFQTEGGERLARARARQARAIAVQANIDLNTTPLTASLESRALWKVLVQRLAEELPADVIEQWVTPVLPRLNGDSFFLFCMNGHHLEQVERLFERITTLTQEINPALTHIAVLVGDGSRLEMAS